MLELVSPNVGSLGVVDEVVGLDLKGFFVPWVSLRCLEAKIELAFRQHLNVIRPQRREILPSLLLA